MELHAVPVELPESSDVIIGQAHLINRRCVTSMADADSRMSVRDDHGGQACV